MKETGVRRAAAWQMKKAGDLSRLARVQLDLKGLAADEVLVEVRAIGLNFADIFAMLGVYSATPKGAFVPGLEFSGVVLEVGVEVSKVKVGDKVMGVCRFGGYTSHLVQSADYLTPIPAGWSFEEAAAYLVQALTAYYSLFSLGNIQQGQKILIHSAAGGVGILANRMAKKMNAYTVGTIGTEAKRELLIKEGYDEVLIRDDSFESKLEASAGKRPFDLVLECIGGKVLEMGYKALAAQGRMIIYGSAHFAETGNKLNKLTLALKFFRRPKIDPLKLISDNKAVMGFNLIWLYEKKSVLEYSLSELSKLNIEKPIVGHTFDFNHMMDAITLFQSGKTTGKVVVTVGQ